MSAINATRQIEAENLAQARSTTQYILHHWELLTWDELLADDVVLCVKLGSIDFNLVGDLGAVGGNLQVRGRQDAKRVLASIYNDIKNGLCVATEIVSGYDVALVGELSLESTKEAALSKSWPLVIYMKFDSYGKIVRMTVTAVDLQPLLDSIRSVLLEGA
jgi:hypothetical protein